MGEKSALHLVLIKKLLGIIALGKCEVPYTKSQFSFEFALKSSYIQESPMALDRSPESWHMMYWYVAKEI